jgi:hypothetical protein
MKLPVIVRPAAETDIRMACHELENARSGLAGRFLDAIKEVIERIGSNPEIYGVIWRDVRAARLKRLRYLLYYVALANLSRADALDTHGE